MIFMLYLYAWGNSCTFKMNKSQIDVNNKNRSLLTHERNVTAWDGRRACREVVWWFDGNIASMSKIVEISNERGGPKSSKTLTEKDLNCRYRAWRKGNCLRKMKRAKVLNFKDISAKDY